MGDRDITVREDKAAPPKAAPERQAKSAGPKTASASTVPAADGCRVYVGNLAWETTEEELMGARAALPPLGRRRSSRRRAATLLCRRRMPVASRSDACACVAAAAHCQSSGTIVHCEVARQSSGRSKGWALVDYATPADAANVRPRTRCQRLPRRQPTLCPARRRARAGSCFAGVAVAGGRRMLVTAALTRSPVAPRRRPLPPCTTPRFAHAP